MVRCPPPTKNIVGKAFLVTGNQGENPDREQYLLPILNFFSSPMEGKDCRCLPVSGQNERMWQRAKPTIHFSCRKVLFFAARYAIKLETPEPGTLSLFVVGIVALSLRRRV